MLQVKLLGYCIEKYEPTEGITSSLTTLTMGLKKDCKKMVFVREIGQRHEDPIRYPRLQTSLVPLELELQAHASMPGVNIHKSMLLLRVP